MTTTEYIMLSKVREIELELSTAKKAFLRESGWDYNCKTNAVWLWCKVIDGVEVRVDESTAMWIAESETPLPYEGQESCPEDYDGECYCNTCLSYDAD